jgi:hypothetical protein
LGLGCGDPEQIEIVGDEEAGRQNWHFQGAFQEMTFASRMQHKIYWGPLKAPMEWTLKTVLAPWSYLASVLYHDTFWYPVFGKRKMQAVLNSDWGRLFRNWETLAPDEEGWADVGTGEVELQRSGIDVFWRSFPVLWLAIKESPEVAAQRRRAVGGHEQGPSTEVGSTIGAVMILVAILGVVLFILSQLLGRGKRKSEGE